MLLKDNPMDPVDVNLKLGQDAAKFNWSTCSRRFALKALSMSHLTCSFVYSRPSKQCTLLNVPQFQSSIFIGTAGRNLLLMRLCFSLLHVNLLMNITCVCIYEFIYYIRVLNKHKLLHLCLFSTISRALLLTFTQV